MSRRSPTSSSATRGPTPPGTPSPRPAAVTGARTITDDATWAWLDSLLETSLEGPVRAAVIEGLGDPAFGADKSAAKLKDIIANGRDVFVRGRALSMLGGHPGAGAG